MRIRREQMEHMLRSDERVLLTAIKRQVRADYAAIIEGIPDDLLDEMIATGVKTARSYGLEAPSDLAGFAYVMFEVGPEFHRHPAVRAVLMDTSIAADQKLRAVFDRTGPEVWDQIVAALARQTWFPELRRQAD